MNVEAPNLVRQATRLGDGLACALRQALHLDRVLPASWVKLLARMDRKDSSSPSLG